LKKLVTIVFLLILSCSKKNSTVTSSSGRVIIADVVQHTSVTIKNETNGSVNLQNWKLVEIRQYILTSGSDTDTYVLPPQILSPGTSRSYDAATLHFILGADETVYLYDDRGTLVSQMYWMFFRK
jgi:P pilus assembly chaperone PapD